MKVGVRHPNLWIFLRKLKDEEKQTRRLLACVERGDAPPKRKRSSRILSRRIRRLKNDYQAGRRSIDQYWKAMTHLIHQFQ